MSLLNIHWLDVNPHKSHSHISLFKCRTKEFLNLVQIHTKYRMTYNIVDNNQKTWHRWKHKQLCICITETFKLGQLTTHVQLLALLSVPTQYCMDSSHWQMRGNAEAHNATCITQTTTKTWWGTKRDALNSPYQQLGFHPGYMCLGLQPQRWQPM